MELYNDDCFNVFPKIADKSIDLFLLDLPYANKKFGNCTACKWDTPVDLQKMWIEIKRTMKPTSMVVFFCNTKFGFALIESNPKWFAYDLIWKKSRKVGFLSANKQPLRQHENIYIFKDKTGTYNPQKTEGKPYKNGAHNNTPNNVYGIYKKEKGSIIKTDRHPTSIIEIEPEIKDKSCYQVHKDIQYAKTRADPKGLEPRHPTSVIDLEDTILEFNNPHKPQHRTQKPVDLCEWLIKTYTNEGDVVCDFTMGSGTVGVACKNINRKFIGVERDEDIYKIAVERINQEY
tara:strand:+ start:3945 stop:4811 length:867 start_codon:yes stop_codon:yes gene_type:complete